MSDNLAIDETVYQSGEILVDGQFVQELRSQMFKFANLQLSDSHLAEDAVQEALAGALKNARSFGGRSALKTWVFAILKHKIADVLRYKQRQLNLSSQLYDDEQELDLLFDSKGHWREGVEPSSWGNPEQTFKQHEFWQVFDFCLNKLPAQQARVFMMREFIELDSDEICATAEISMSNLFVTLHRARMRLGKCLEQNWFLREE